RLTATAAVMIGLLAASIAGATLVGPVAASVRTALSPGGAATPDYAIIFRTRLPRVLLGAVVGGALACSGAGLQALLGNPLADPHLLGVSAGAAVGGAIALVAGADPVSPVVPLAAFLGALGTVGSVFLVARAAGRTSPYAILLVGVVCNAVGAAAIMLVNALASYTQAQGILFWIMGSLTAQSYGLVAGVLAYVIAGAAVLVRHAHHLNLLAAGEEGALTLGVEVETVRRAGFFARPLLLGPPPPQTGIINFVGLIVPHLLRL